MENLDQVTIETDRLRLVPISEEYAPEIFREFDQEITKYMYPKTPEKIEETLKWINRAKEQLAKGKRLEVVILLKETGEFLGCCGVDTETETPELGIWTKKSAHGNHYGREAITALVEWTKKNLDYKYLIYPVDRRNIASRSIPESLGGVIGNEYKKPNLAGNILDEIEYRIYPS